MNENQINLCRICLRSDIDLYAYESSVYRNFFIQVIGVKDFSQNVVLCGWCNVGLKRALKLILLARKSQKALENWTQRSDVSSQRLYSLSYHNNDNIDIPELEEDKKSTLNEDIEYINETSEMLEINVPQGNNEKETNEKLKRRLNYEELKFTVENLTNEEQKKEIEIRKLTDKYKSMKYTCSFCGIGFLSEDVYLEHSLRHEKTSGLYECGICHLRFKSKDVFSQHKLAHRRRFSCLLCATRFSRWQHCVAHRFKCGTPPSPVVCCYCKKIFSNDLSLDVHIKGVHKKEKKHVCDQCDRRFASKQRLAVHMRIHTGLKEFSCSLCPRSFATNSNLRAHQSVHSNDKQHYCVECNSYYKTKKGLRRHFVESVRHLVKEKLVYSCTECPKTFATEKSLKTHVTTRHLTSYQCDVCSKLFSNNANLKKHVRCVHSTFGEPAKEAEIESS